MKDDLRYTPSDCFETFPFPKAWRSDANLDTIGKTYYEFRAKLMISNDEGLTKTYNRFHNPEETSSDINRLRELHQAMDRAVLDAYGWSDIQPKCEFIAEFEDEDEEDESGRHRRRKYRYRWPDDVRDEMLARLLELNRQRALEEGQVVAGRAAARDAEPKKTSTRKSKVEKNSTSGLFAMDQEES